MIRGADADAEVPPSKRVRCTDVPCIVAMQKMLKGKQGVMSLAQGIVHWAPPPCVPKAVAEAAAEPYTNAYGPDEGMPDLRVALEEKLHCENGLKPDDVAVMVTAGANQAYANVVIALLDADDGAVLFAPYYFNHLMAIQMTGGSKNLVVGPVRKDDYLPDVDWLERRLADQGGCRIKVVTVVNPCNPTGVMMPAAALERLRAVCEKHRVWLVVDNTYESFTYEEEGHPPHAVVGGSNVVNVFSFSKAYGMMGWRVGYLAYPRSLHDELMKVQDTIAICPPIASQRAALAALKGGGRAWVREQVKGLAENRKVVRSALEAAVGAANVVGGSGAIYMMVRLPVEDDLRVVEWLTEKHQICVIPGSACGLPGFVRVGYANMETERTKEAAGRLLRGLTELAQKGAAALEP